MENSRKGRFAVFIGLGLIALTFLFWLRHRATTDSDGTLKAASALHREGQRLVNRGDFAKALPKLWKAYHVRREMLGLSDSNTLATLNQLSTALDKQGDWTNALRLIPDLAQLEHDEVGKKFEEIARNATNEFGRTMARQTLQMWGMATSAQAAAREALPRYYSNLIVDVLNSPLNVALSDSATTYAAILDEELGYSPEQIKARKILDAAQERWKQIHWEKMASGRMTDDDWKTYPIPASLGIKISLIPTNMPGRGVEMENHLRRMEAGFAARDPTNYETLKNYNFYSHDRAPVDDGWFEKAWDEAQDRFDQGIPWTQLLQDKAASGTTTQLPASAETEPRIMALVALNLKGLFLEREFRLQAALAASKISLVIDAQRKAREAEAAALRVANDGLLQANDKNMATAANKLGAALDASNRSRKAQLRVRQLGLTQPDTGRGRIVPPESVAPALPANSVLVEFLHYGRDPGGTLPIEPRYGAVLIPAGGPPQWVPLAPVRDISRLIDNYADILRRPVPLSEAERKIQAWDLELKTTLSKLAASVWDTVVAAFPADTRTVFLAPDGDLHRISFAALPDKGGFVADRFEIRYLLSGRDVLKSVQPLTESRTIEIWTDPDFDAALPNAPRSSTDYQAGRVRFDFLPETRDVVGMLTGLTGHKGRLQVRSHVGKEASESGLAGTSSPLVLHLGTHGVYVPLRRKSADTISAAEELQEHAHLVEPLYRCALAFAGAHSTIDSWTSDFIAPPDADGLLLPVEAAQLKLRGTWLTTLAACDTGVGGGTAGEGFFCLKFGFLQAGSQNVLFSLWPLDREYTPVFLRSFYQDALSSGDAVGALARTQRAHLNALAAGGKPVSLWKRVRMAGPFAVVSRGQTKLPQLLTEK